MNIQDAYRKAQENIKDLVEEKETLKLEIRLLKMQLEGKDTKRVDITSRGEKIERLISRGWCCGGSVSDDNTLMNYLDSNSLNDYYLEYHFSDVGVVYRVGLDSRSSLYDVCEDAWKDIDSDFLAYLIAKV
jgi:hypothetical protein